MDIFGTHHHTCLNIIGTIIKFKNLDMFFGGGGNRGRRERKGKDVVHQMAVTLEEMYNGSVRKLALQKNVICGTCEGTLVTCKVEGGQVFNHSLLQDLGVRRELWNAALIVEGVVCKLGFSKLVQAW